MSYWASGYRRILVPTHKHLLHKTEPTRPIVPNSNTFPLSEILSSISNFVKTSAKNGREPLSFTLSLSLSLSVTMAPHFLFPQTLRALEEEHEDNRLCAQNPIDISSLHPSELEEFVKGHSLSLSFCVLQFH
jgi:hypothetical protein